MTYAGLARDYMIKATKRLKILDVLFDEEDYSDVIRESQEVVELALKAILRQIGIDPPKWHDVGMILLEQKDKLIEIEDSLDELAKTSKWLRKERELAFYGDIDFIPSQEYSREDAVKAIQGAKLAVDAAKKMIKL